MSIDRYAYLLLGLFFFALWIAAYSMRKDLRPMMLKISLAGAICGPISELWFFRDYWLPPTIVGTGRISPEDVLFGFSVFGVAFAALPVLTQKYFSSVHHPRPVLIPLFAASFFVGFFLFTDLLGLNSILAASLTFLSWAVVLVFLRHELLLPALGNGTLLAAFAMIIYRILLPLSPEYLSRYWLLWEKPLGLIVLGVPATEILWYFCLGCSTIVVAAFAEGKRL